MKKMIFLIIFSLLFACKNGVKASLKQENAKIDTLKEYQKFLDYLVSNDSIVISNSQKLLVIERRVLDCDLPEWQSMYFSQKYKLENTDSVIRQEMDSLYRLYKSGVDKKDLLLKNKMRFMIGEPIFNNKFDTVSVAYRLDTLGHTGYTSVFPKNAEFMCLGVPTWLFVKKNETWNRIKKVK